MKEHEENKMLRKRLAEMNKGDDKNSQIVPRKK